MVPIKHSYMTAHFTGLVQVLQLNVGRGKASFMGQNNRCCYTVHSNIAVYLCMSTFWILGVFILHVSAILRLYVIAMILIRNKRTENQ